MTCAELAEIRDLLVEIRDVQRASFAYLSTLIQALPSRSSSLHVEYRTTSLKETPS
jgi:hypothetical protein